MSDLLQTEIKESKQIDDSTNHGKTLKDLSTLLTILSCHESSKNYTFDSIASLFYQHFNKQDSYRISTSLVLLLRNKDLLPKVGQRLIAIYLLFDMYKTDNIANNPFAPIFVHMHNPPTERSDGTNTVFHWAIPEITDYEKSFIAKLISEGTKDLLKKTPNSFLANHPNFDEAVDISGLQLSLVERQSAMSAISKSAMPVIVPIPEEYPDYQSQSTENVLAEISNMLLYADKYMTPQFVRPPCPMSKGLDEMAMILPNELSNIKPCWHHGVCEATEYLTEARRLLSLAYNRRLQITQEHLLVAIILDDENIVFQLGLTPQKLPDLVENNPLVSIEILIKLMNSAQSSEYLNVLVNMELSLHSMEVVNRLTTSLDLPSEFIHLYITNCISTCENIKDRLLQNRLVRLVCVFLQSLIRNRIVDIKDIFIEVQAFCIEFSRIREAASLFRLLKTLDSDTMGINNAVTAPMPTSNTTPNANNNT